ncbi:expressed unknown protein [Seminavis robusta]|uniref:Uncharacterized protein n=1 Tax=Seminavis robusta TaxID=568900 RepID=A0A9N8ES31_9STRA|nr:expressed unknown protein [Seminavis robusta]|eukprot:Sro1621_g286570.1 n/a (134) ;mRNA; r:6917-7318
MVLDLGVYNQPPGRIRAVIDILHQKKQEIKQNMRTHYSPDTYTQFDAYAQFVAAHPEKEELYFILLHAQQRPTTFLAFPHNQNVRNQVDAFLLARKKLYLDLLDPTQGQQRENDRRAVQAKFFPPPAWEMDEE